MAKDWKRLGQAVKRAREQRDMTQTELAEATGQDDSTIQNLETARYGRGFSRMPSSAKLVAAFFGWADHSLKDLLAGGEPTPAQLPAPPRSAPQPAATRRGPVFRDPRYQAIIDSSLPYEEKEQMILDLVRAALDRARDQEPEPDRYAG